jgi:hypothetical protein
MEFHLCISLDKAHPSSEGTQPRIPSSCTPSGVLASMVPSRLRGYAIATPGYHRDIPSGE